MMLYYYILLALYLKAVAEASASANQDTNRATSYLIAKWEQWFDKLDVNDDGFLSLDDIKQFGKFYDGLDNLRDGQLQTLIDTLTWLWRTIILNFKIKVSKDDFVKTMKQRYECDKTDFVQMIRFYISEKCKVIDLDGDNYLSKEEFLMNTAALGNNGIAKEKEFFNKFMPINERIPLAEIIAYFERFVTEGNKSKPDIFKDAFDSGA